MMAVDERPTIGERYTSATESSNLRLGAKRSDVDVIIAAGLVPDGFGLTLYRLMAEFDAVRGPVDAAKRWVTSQMTLAAYLRGEATREAARDKPDEWRVLDLTRNAKQVQEAAVASLRTEFLLALTIMRTLREAKYAVGGFAIDLAHRRRFNLDDEQVLRVAGRALEVLLDPLCHFCQGRGYNGGGRHEQTGPQSFCRPCRNSGHRRDAIGKDDSERLFASQLLMQMDAELSAVQSSIKREMWRLDEAKRMIAEQTGVAFN